MERCELTHLTRVPIDLQTVRAQHEAYVTALRDCGLTITTLDAPADLPDAVFIEDTAVVVPEVTVLTRPGALARRAEVSAVMAALASRGPAVTIQSPGTLDGGDVLVAGHTVFVGSTPRSNESGRAQLAAALAPFGYTVKTVSVQGCLHLKSAVTLVAPGTLVHNPDWVDAESFPDWDLIPVHPEEPWAANVLCVGATVMHAAAGARTAARFGPEIATVELDMSELAKAEGGVTCCSLLIP